MSIENNELHKLANTSMPYGKYRGRRLIDLPESYVIWLNNNEVPNNEFGRLMKLLYEIQLNGLESLVRPLKS
jgi:uncharacterized protein (DUF3820 family)